MATSCAGRQLLALVIAGLAKLPAVSTGLHQIRQLMNVLLSAETCQQRSEHSEVCSRLFGLTSPMLKVWDATYHAIDARNRAY